MIKPILLNMFLVKKIAAMHEIHERTLLKALSGKAIRGASVAVRAQAAVQSYHKSVASSAAKKDL